LCGLGGLADEEKKVERRKGWRTLEYTFEKEKEGTAETNINPPEGCAICELRKYKTMANKGKLHRSREKNKKVHQPGGRSAHLGVLWERL